MSDHNPKGVSIKNDEDSAADQAISAKIGEATGGALRKRLSLCRARYCRP